MRLFYPYNEILPRKKAHDVFIFQECSCLASLGVDVTLLCGSGSAENETLFHHYNVSDRFNITRLPCVRKNNPLNFSWNLPFFYFSGREIKKLKPDIVVISVLKQAAYNLKRKVPGVKYLYEVHELAAYPGEKYDPARVSLERFVFERVDGITVTTEALKRILLSDLYRVRVPIEVVPLAVGSKPLPKPTSSTPLTLFYVGQLYEGQGLPLLLRALAEVSNVDLKIVGGQKPEIEILKNLAMRLGLEKRVHFFGFRKPSEVPELLHEAHAFVAPFLPSKRMPYVAHTKLAEYCEWGRPIIAPDLASTREHFPEGKGVLFFEPGDFLSLSRCIKKMELERARLQVEIETTAGSFGWKKRGQHYLELFKKLL